MISPKAYDLHSYGFFVQYEKGVLSVGPGLKSNQKAITHPYNNHFTISPLSMKCFIGSAVLWMVQIHCILQQKIAFSQEFTRFFS